MGLSRRAWGALALLTGAAGAVVVAQPSCTEAPPSTVEVVSRAAVARYDWMQFGGGPSHSGSNTLETDHQPSRTSPASRSSSR